MSFRISGKNLEVGEALRARIEARVAEALSKYFDGGYSGHATVEREGTGFRTECALHLDFKSDVTRGRQRAGCLRQCRPGGPACGKKAAPLSPPVEGAPFARLPAAPRLIGPMRRSAAERKSGAQVVPPVKWKTSQFRDVMPADGCPLTQFPALPMVRRLLRMVPKNPSPDVKLGRRPVFRKRSCTTRKSARLDACCSGSR